MGQLVFVPYSSGGSSPSTTWPLNIYVDPTGGSDANTGLTTGSPVQTMTRVWEIVPSVLEGAVVVHFASGTIDWVKPPQFTRTSDDAAVIFYADGAGQGVQDGFTVVSSGTTGAGTNALHLELGGGGTTNAFQGLTLQLRSGPLSGYNQTVRNNTTGPTTAYQVVQWGSPNTVANPGAGVTYRVVSPATTMAFAAAANAQGTTIAIDDTGATAFRAPYVFINFNFTALTTNAPIVFTNTNVKLYGVRAVTGSISLTESQLNAGWADLVYNSDSGEYTYDADQNWAQAIGLTSGADLAKWQGWGLTFAGTSFYGVYGDVRSRFIGTLVCPYVNNYPASEEWDNQLTMPYRILGAGITTGLAISNAEASFGTGYGPGSDQSILINGSVIATDRGIIDIDAPEINLGANDYIFASFGSYIYLGTTAAVVTKTGNTRPAVLISEFSELNCGYAFTISSVSTNAALVLIDKSSKMRVSANMSITSAGAVAVAVRNNSSLEVTGTFAGISSGSTGVEVSSNSVVSVEGTFTGTGANIGALFQSNAQVRAGSAGSFTASGAATAALQMKSANAVFGASTSFVANAGVGLDMSNGSNLDINGNLTITALGTGAQVTTNSTLSIAGFGLFQSTAGVLYGLYAGTGGKVSCAGNLQCTAVVGLGLVVDSGSSVIGNGTLTASGPSGGAYVIGTLSVSGNTTISSTTNTGLDVYGGKVIVGGTLSATSAGGGASAYGLNARSNAIVSVGGNTTCTGSASEGLLIEKNAQVDIIGTLTCSSTTTAASVTTNGQLNVSSTGSLTVTGVGTGYGLNVADGAKVTFSGALTATGQTGGVYVVENGTLTCKATGGVLTAGAAGHSIGAQLGGRVYHAGGVQLVSAAGYGIDASLGGFVTVFADLTLPSAAIYVGPAGAETDTAANFNGYAIDRSISNIVTGQGGSTILKAG